MATKKTVSEPVVEESAKEEPSNREGAKKIVRRHVLYSMGVGLIPIPIVDYAGLTLVQLKMLKELSDQYDINYTENLGKSIVSTLLGVIIPSSLNKGILGSAIKAIPLIGGILGAITFPSFAGASTYAMGEVFTNHFESGGDLLDMNMEKTKTYFKSAFEKKAADKETEAPAAEVVN